MLIFSLRREARISGEAASFRLLEEVIAELGIAHQVIPADDSKASPTLAAGRRLSRLRKIATANSVSTLIVKIPTAAQLPFAAFATRDFRGRLIFWIDGLLWSPPKTIGQWRASLLAEPLLTLARIVANNAVWTRLVRSRSFEIVVASQTQKAELASRLPASRIHVVPNGTPAPALPRKAVDTRPFTAGYIGHAYLVKGVWDMLDAYRRLAGEGLGFPFRCALSGLGSDCFGHHARVAGMEVLGEIEKPAFYQSLDLLIAPYWAAWGTQTFPNVLLEALQYGVPVLTSDLPLCRELFPDDLAHFVPPSEPVALAATLGKIARRELPVPAAERLRVHFAAHYSRECIVEGWREVLRGSAPANSDRAHD